jgi:(p)ppGpp synthase/HD superfamily hydrolase
VTERIFVPDETLLPSLLREPDLVERARVLALAMHRGQRDKAGNDYFTAHLTDVHRRTLLYGASEDEQAAAWLHDVVEDTAVTEEVLLDAGFSATTLLIVHLMTRRDGEAERVYYSRLRAFEPARRLKLEADVASNADPAKLARVAEPKRSELAAKYDKARRLLSP